MPVERLRWISFSHFEADESGAMNLWQEHAPQAQVVHGRLAATSRCATSRCGRRGADDGEVLDLGGKRVRYLATPHLPHGWDAGLMLEERTGTLLCSDLLGQVGDGPALLRGDIVGPALESENALALDERDRGDAVDDRAAGGSRSRSGSRSCTALRSRATAPPRSGLSPAVWPCSAFPPPRNSEEGKR